MSMKINEQILALRKQKQVTQEEVAVALGVTNQAVSKWESGQCCPDIQLLADMANYFEVSIDELMGVNLPLKPDPEPTENISVIAVDPLLDSARHIAMEAGKVSTSLLQRQLRIGYGRAKKLIDTMVAQGHITATDIHGLHVLALTQSNLDKLLAKAIKDSPDQSNAVVLNTAMAMHTALFFKKQKGEPYKAGCTESALNHQPWGYSAISEAEITTVMRGQSVFYSKNTNLDFTSDRIAKICSLLKILSDRKNLTVFSALYELTVHSEEEFADISDIAEKSQLPQDAAKDRLEESLFPYLCEENGKYRIQGEAMSILPILSILTY